MENSKSSRLPLILLSAVLIALLAYLNWPQEQSNYQRQARVVSVKVAAVKFAEFSDEFEALGTTTANEQVTITAQYSDIVETLSFDDGDTVKKGDILVEFAKAQEQAKVNELEANLEVSVTQLKRLKELSNQKVGSIAQTEEQQAKVRSIRAQLMSAQAVLDNLTIRAPFDGQLGFRQVSVGEFVNNGEEITILDDISVVKVDFAIPERFITTVTKGQKVSATNVAYPGKQFIGEITSIATRIDANTRTIQVRAKINNADKYLRPGMLMSILLQRNVEETLQLPESGIIPFEDRHFVFVVEDGVAKRVDVVIGRRKPGLVEVKSGVLEGTPVVIEGALKLREGSAVSIIGSNTASQDDQTKGKS
ncbi:efflux RND transporter periplasmic adaptor subunit [Thalassotalea crassostreae]|uniref:efflux RND transporter periplasmic adaptor subunit n=1 Tax=Thalassotalea crassostreae TaxID=1763536 RepID=UPI000837FF9F|nr:efflux RND transporter periplasmic adaptor subunit [Thalassotalea crassostreae]